MVKNLTFSRMQESSAAWMEVCMKYCYRKTSMFNMFINQSPYILLLIAMALHANCFVHQAVACQRNTGVRRSYLHCRNLFHRLATRSDTEKRRKLEGKCLFSTSSSTKYLLKNDLFLCV